MGNLPFDLNIRTATRVPGPNTCKYMRRRGKEIEKDCC